MAKDSESGKTRKDYWQQRFSALPAVASPRFRQPTRTRDTGAPPVRLQKPRKPREPKRLPYVPTVAPPDLSWRFVTRRERAAKLRERMEVFSAIYNAGWLLRNAQYGPSGPREDIAWRFLAVMEAELRACKDPEALIYAIADTIACSPHGLPWEG